jgi:hypothetical protein
MRRQETGRNRLKAMVETSHCSLQGHRNLRRAVLMVWEAVDFGGQIAWQAPFVFPFLLLTRRHFVPPLSDAAV